MAHRGMKKLGGGGVFHTMEQFCVKKMIDRSLRNDFVYYL